MYQPLTSAERRAADAWREWGGREKLRRGGFRDIEDAAGNLTPGLPDPGDHRGRHTRVIRLFEGQRFDDAGARPMASLSAVADHFGAAFWRFPFACARDQAICLCLAKGWTWEEIRTWLRCSPNRIQRVSEAVRAWTDPDDEEE